MLAPEMDRSQRPSGLCGGGSGAGTMGKGPSDVDYNNCTSIGFVEMVQKITMKQDERIGTTCIDSTDYIWR